jgi:hypothetical protein
MIESDERFARQLQLADVGPEGQARIIATTATISDAPGSAVEREYLQRAGVRHFDDTEQSEHFIHAGHFRSEGCRGVAFGAWRALTQIRKVLDPSNEGI